MALHDTETDILPIMDDERNDPGAEADGTDGPGPPRAKGGRRGRGTRPTYPDRPCRNCGDPTSGEYCPSCGQRKVDVQVSVRALVMEVLEDDFILDRRLPRTLGALLFKPGFLTVEHVNGRIVRYIHPFRLYLVSSILFFLLLSFFSLQFVRRAMERDAESATARQESGPLADSLAALRVELADTARPDEDLAALRAREAELLQRQRRAHLDSLTQQVADLNAALAQIDAVTTDTVIPGAVRSGIAGNRGMIQRQLEAATERRQVLLEDTAAAASDSRSVESGLDDRPLREVFNWDDDPPTINFRLVPAIQPAIDAQLQRIAAMTAREAVETLMGTFFNYVPTMMFILLPLFAAVLKLLYIRRRRFYAEHFVFLLHVHSMVFILAMLILLVRRFVPSLVEVAVILWVLVYIFLAMKRVYGQGWLKTLAKYWTLGWMYFWILAISTPFVFLATLLLF